MSRTSSRLMGISWPVSAFVVGVNRVSGKGSPSLMPAGIAAPPTVPSAWYSAHAEPVMYPRTTHSMSMRSALFTTIARAATSGGMSSRPACLPGSYAIATRWLGTIWPVFPNQ